MLNIIVLLLSGQWLNKSNEFLVLFCDFFSTNESSEGISSMVLILMLRPNPDLVPSDKDEFTTLISGILDNTVLGDVGTVIQNGFPEIIKQLTA